jgi:hypothetical protein
MTETTESSSTKRTVRRKRRRIKRATPAVVLICAIACLLIGSLERPRGLSLEARSLRTRLASDPGIVMQGPKEGFRPKRRIYPHSVIPGGIQSRAELTRHMEIDPVVAAHYSDFNVTGARKVLLREEQLVHVSYRLDKKIFWTNKKIRLAPGEELITDGREFARARCGNRLSILPQEPISPEEPPTRVLEIPLVSEEPEPTLPDIAGLAPMLQELADPQLTIPPLRELFKFDDKTQLPFVPVTPTMPPTYVVPPSTPTPDIPGVPEPNTLILLGSGLLAMFVAWMALKK